MCGRLALVTVMSPLRLIQGASFDPEETRLMGLAYEEACADLGSSDASTREFITRRIIEAAKRGERNVHALARYGREGFGEVADTG
jgi:hypothetical protein